MYEGRVYVIYRYYIKVISLFLVEKKKEIYFKIFIPVNDTSETLSRSTTRWTERCRIPNRSVSQITIITMTTVNTVISRVYSWRLILRKLSKSSRAIYAIIIMLYYYSASKFLTLALGRETCARNVFNHYQLYL